MYSSEERGKAVELYIKYGESAAPVIRELGYPYRHTLRSWYMMYLEEQKTGTSHDRYTRAPKFTKEQKETAVRHYLEHGRNYSRTARILGYLSRETLRKWCAELAPDRCKKRGGGIHSKHGRENAETPTVSCDTPCSTELHSQDTAVVGDGGAATATPCNTTTVPLDREVQAVMPTEGNERVHKSKEELLAEIELLEKRIKRLKMEQDVLEMTAELIKKDPGVDPKNLANREKTFLVDALRNDHPLKELLDCMRISRSSYFYNHSFASAKDKYEKLKERIRILFEENGGRYGYRRIHALLHREGMRISEKVVRRCMAECALVVLGKKKRKYSSYQGEKTPGAENLLNRDFHSDAPNIKWLTDITEFSLPSGKVYLSPIIDCFDGMVVSWTIGTSPDAELVNSMLDMATATLKYNELPIVHSDRGAHYRWPGWIERMENAGLARSMSRKGCSPDNAACEGFFGRLKNEMFYNRKWSEVSVDEFMDIVTEYLHWYNEKRIKMSLGAMSPMEFRKSLDSAA